MSTFTGGALKLKGGVVLQKKKFKKEDPAKLADKAQAALEEKNGNGSAARAVVLKDKDGFAIPEAPSAVDRRTEEEKKRDENLKKRELEMIKKAASKSYRERVREYNEYLASMTEHVSCEKAFEKYSESFNNFQ